MGGIFGSRDKGGGDGGAAERARKAAEEKAAAEKARLEAIAEEEKKQKARGKRGFKSLLTGDMLGYPDDENLGGTE